ECRHRRDEHSPIALTVSAARDVALPEAPDAPEQVRKKPVPRLRQPLKISSTLCRVAVKTTQHVRNVGVDPVVNRVREASTVTPGHMGCRMHALVSPALDASPI